MKGHIVVTGALALVLAHPAPVPAQEALIQEKVAELKASLAASQAALRQYEWIETTVVSLKGEEKSRRQNRCYHGADGVLQKVPVAAAPPPDKKRGLRGKIAENKKEELTDYMQEAVALVKQYVPPDPGRIQAAKDAGKVTLQPVPGPGKRFKLTFADYLKPGDSLMVDVDFAANALMGARISTSLGSPPEPVGLDVVFAMLDEGASYSKGVVLDAQAKQLRVDVQNSGYRKLR